LAPGRQPIAFARAVFNAYRCKQPLVEQRHDLLKNILFP
jgi:hypothetical protein